MNYNNMTCVQLKEILGVRGLKKSGRKADLIQRLIDSDSHPNLKPSEVPYIPLKKKDFEIGQRLLMPEIGDKFVIVCVVDIQSKKVVVQQPDGSKHRMMFNYPFRLLFQ